MCPASGALSNVSDSLASGFDSPPVANSEELIAAAHAGCFSMDLAAFDSEGLKAGRIDTSAALILEQQGDQWTIPPST